jgi:hypothetical protein
VPALPALVRAPNVTVHIDAAVHTQWRSGALPMRRSEPFPLSDCEPVRADGVAQPVNAATAGAYVGVGLWLFARSASATSPAVARAYALAVMALGGGSLLYHASGGPAARWLHDVTLTLPLVMLAAGSGAAAAGRGERDALVLGGVGGLATGGTLLAAPGLAVSVAGVVAGLAVVATGLAGGLRRGPRPARWATAVALLAALPFQLWGRTGGPLCRDGVPAHGVWHLLTAAALGAAGVAFAEPLALPGGGRHGRPRGPGRGDRTEGR